MTLTKLVLALWKVRKLKAAGCGWEAVYQKYILVIRLIFLIKLFQALVEVIVITTAITTFWTFLPLPKLHTQLAVVPFYRWSCYPLNW